MVPTHTFSLHKAQLQICTKNQGTQTLKVLALHEYISLWGIHYFILYMTLSCVRVTNFGSKKHQQQHGPLESLRALNSATENTFKYYIKLSMMIQNKQHTSLGQLQRIEGKMHPEFYPFVYSKDRKQIKHCLPPEAIKGKVNINLIILQNPNLQACVSCQHDHCDSQERISCYCLLPWPSQQALDRL